MTTSCFNLLPHRTWARRRRQFTCAWAAGLSGLLSLGLVAAWAWTCESRVAGWQRDNAHLERAIAALDAELAQRTQLSTELAALQLRHRGLVRLQAERRRPALLLQELSRLLPEGAGFTRVQQSGKAIHLAGRARSNGEISQLLRALGDSPWLAEPRLGEIVWTRGPSADGRATPVAVFQLSVQWRDAPLDDRMTPEPET